MGVATSAETSMGIDASSRPNHLKNNVSAELFGCVCSAFHLPRLSGDIEQRPFCDGAVTES